MLREFIPKYKDKITVVNNIVDIDDIIKKSKKQPSEAFKSDCFNIVTCGRLSKEKGADLAIEACKILLDRGFSDIKWRFLGEGPQSVEINELVKKLRLENTFLLTGVLMNPYADMAGADLYVQPSRFESYCIAIAEAMILGKPVVATKAAGCDHIEDGVNGVLCEPEAKSLADAIEKVIGDKELLKKITEASEKTDLTKQNEAALKKLYNIF